MKIDRWIYEQIAILVKGLADTPEVGGSALDNTVIMTGNGMCEGADHGVQGIPWLLIGSCGGYFKTGRVVKFGTWIGKTGNYFTAASGVPHNKLLATHRQRHGRADDRLRTGPVRRRPARAEGLTARRRTRATALRAVGADPCVRPEARTLRPTRRCQVRIIDSPEAPALTSWSAPRPPLMIETASLPHRLVGGRFRATALIKNGQGIETWLARGPVERPPGGAEADAVGHRVPGDVAAPGADRADAGRPDQPVRHRPPGAGPGGGQRCSWRCPGCRASPSASAWAASR